MTKRRPELVQHYEDVGRLFGPDISPMEARYVIDVWQEILDPGTGQEVPGLKHLEGRILDLSHDVLWDLQRKELTLRLHGDRLECRLQLQPDGRIIPRSALTDVAPQ